MKTISSCKDEAFMKWQDWLEIANDPVALSDRKKTKDEALQLASYFEGRFDAFTDAMVLAKT